jgi:8-oxo-dGTP pyrophosphatase MutT (NUDIX family)
MRCGECARRFFINAAAAVIALIRDERGRLLFTRRRNDPAAGKLDFPGGFVDLGERAEDAVRREVKEELGLDLSETRFVMSIPNRYLFGGIVYFTLDLVFECRCPDLSKIAAADDVSGFVFAHPAQIDPEEMGLESARNVLIVNC